MQNLAEYYSNSEANFRCKIFLLTLILIGYTLIEGLNYSFNVLYFLVLIWGLFAIIYSFKDKGKLGDIARKLVECCKKW